MEIARKLDDGQTIVRASSVSKVFRYSTYCLYIRTVQYSSVKRESSQEVDWLHGELIMRA